MLRAILDDEALDLRLLVCGMHLSSAFGMTVDEIESDGIPIAEKIETLSPDDTAAGMARTIANTVRGFADSFEGDCPDILMVMGDRPEMLAAASAALPFGIPVAHLHGGELTFGAIDDSIRHALTKMSHLHFAATETYAARIVQMGEEPANVHVTGGPGLDNLHAHDPLDGDALEKIVGLPVDPAPLLCTFHPVTLESADTMKHLEAMLEAIAGLGLPAIFTYPNADTEGRRIIDRLKLFTEGSGDRVLVANLGTRAYFSLMARAAAMVGNSSSGITEAASFRLPVVNIGSRQGGRLRAANIIDVAPVADAIAAGIETAISAEFRQALKTLVNPYGDGRAAERIVRHLRETPLGRDLTMKKFRDIAAHG